MSEWKYKKVKVPKKNMDFLTVYLRNIENSTAINQFRYFRDIMCVPVRITICVTSGVTRETTRPPTLLANFFTIIYNQQDIVSVCEFSTKSYIKQNTWKSKQPAHSGPIRTTPEQV